MYSSENSSFDIKDIIVKILFLIFFAIILYWLYPKFPEIGNFDSLTDRVYHENITAMKEAAVDYYTTDRLPKNVGDMSEMTLQRMIDLKLIVPFVDKDGNSCDVNNSYVQVTKEQDEYVMKVALVCGKQNDYIVEHIGCHNVCKDCTVDKKDDKKTETKTNTNTNTNNKVVVVNPTTKYTVKVKATNGTVKTSKLTVVKGKNTSTTVKPKSGYKYSKVTCTNGQKATYSNNKLTVKNVKASTVCTVKFVKKSTTASKYIIDVYATNGLVTNDSIEAEKGETVYTTVQPNDGYIFDEVTCTNDQKATWSDNTLKVKNVTKSASCVVAFKKGTKPADEKDDPTKKLVKVAVVNGYANTPSKEVKSGSDASFTVAANTGYDIFNRTVACTKGAKYEMSGNKLTVQNVTADTACVITIGKTNYTKYTVTVKVMNGSSDVASKTVAPNSQTAFTITPNSGYTVTGATVACGGGLKGEITSKTLVVSNIKADGSCIVTLKKGDSTNTNGTANVVKTFYSVGYTKKTGTFTYTVTLNDMPNHVVPSKVKAVGVSIKPMETYQDFANYVISKKAEELTMVGGNSGYSVTSNTASTIQAHALTSKNFTAKAVAGCTSTKCQVVITDTVANLTGVTPTGTITYVNGTTDSGLYYLPVKFIVTFKYEI